MKSLCRNIYRTRIGRQMLFIILAIIIPMLLINLFIVSWSSDNIRETVTQEYANALTMAAEQLEDRLANLQQLTKALIIDDDVNKISIAESDRMVLFDFSLLQAKLRSFTLQQSNNREIMAFFPKQGWLISNVRIKAYKSRQDLEKLLSMAGANMKWDIRKSVIDPEKSCMSVSMGYVHAQQSNPVFFVELDDTAVMNALAGLGDSNGVSNVFILGTNNDIFYQKESTINKDVLLKEIDKTHGSDDMAYPVQLQYKTQTEHHSIIMRRFNDSDCIVGIVLDDDTVFQSQNIIRFWSLAAVCVFLIGVIIYTLSVHRQIVIPITALQTAMEQVGHGDFTFAENVIANNEIGDITYSFNRMTSELKKTIDDKYVGEMRLAKTQMKYLRAQINPHFLYNSLFALYTLIKNEQLEEAADLTIYLGQYYQLNTHSSERETQLYQELEYVRLLVKIQNIRSSNHLIYSEKIDDSLKTMVIPRLTLLTVSENFLTHGFRNLNGDASLMITAKEDTDKIVLTVSDTGVGVDDVQLLEIRESLRDIRPDSDNIRGLQNALLRFRAMYGENVDFIVERNVPHGFTVNIVIPRGR